MNRIGLIGLVGALASAANAQLVIGFDDTASGVTTCYEIRVSDGSNVATPLFSDIDVWALASDNVNNKLYVGSGTDLYMYDGSGAPTLLGQTTIGGAAASLVGYAFSDGKLYATRNIANEGVYEVNLTTFEATLVLDYDDASYDFGGFDYGQGSFYGTNDDTSPVGSGLFTIDLNGSINQIAPYPSGESDIDGLAIGGGIAYMIEDEPGLTIHRYDLNGNAYLSALDSPFQSSEVFSAGAYATWIPTPGGAAVLAIAGLGAMRRRRGA